MTLEAEDGNYDGMLMYRSEASSGLAVLLNEGQTIRYGIVIRDNGNSCFIKLLHVTYSNDGDGDDIQVLLNNTVLGSFRTYAISDNGESWNDFHTESGFSTEKELHVSPYILTIRVLEADQYGVEIDKLSLQLECINTIRAIENAECQPPLISFDNSEDNSDTRDRGLSDGAIVGIVFGVLAVVIGVPGCIVATKVLLFSD